MANEKISSMGTVTSLTATDAIPLAKSGSNYRTNPNQITNYVLTVGSAPFDAASGSGGNGIGITMTAGAGDGAGDGGGMYFTSGSPGAGGMSGGRTVFRTANAYGAGGIVGQFAMYAGYGDDGTPGNLAFYGGFMNGSGRGGNLAASGGYSMAGNGGDVGLNPGQSGASLDQGGLVKVNGNPALIPITYCWKAGDNPGGRTIFTLSRGMKVLSIVVRPDVLAGGAATITAAKAASGTAISGGTILTTDTANLNSSANTIQTLTMSAAPGVVFLSAGDSIGLATTGTFVASAGCITIWGTPI